MHRQSLGSPITKLHGHGGPKDDSLIVLADSGHDSIKRKLDLSAASPSSSSAIAVIAAVRPRRSSISLSPPISPDRLIHAIPLLTLLCFLVLFLFSHSPSQSEMSQFKGFNWPATKLTDSGESVIGDEIGRLSDLRKNDAMAIQSLRNLREIQNRNSKPIPFTRRHRKHADF